MTVTNNEDIIPDTAHPPVDYKANFTVVRITGIISVIGLIAIVIGILYTMSTVNNTAYPTQPHNNWYFGGGGIFILIYILSTYPYMNEKALYNEKTKINGWFISICKGITYLNALLLCIAPVGIIAGAISDPFSQGTIILVSISTILCLYILSLFYYTVKSSNIIRLHDLSLIDKRLSVENEIKRADLPSDEVLTPRENTLKSEAINTGEQTIIETVDKENIKEEVITTQEKADDDKAKKKERFLLDKKITLFENLGLPQKIIYSITTLAITFIICYVIAYNIDYRDRLTKTWLVWVIFILVQAWVQAKLWTLNSTLELKFKVPSFFTRKQHEDGISKNYSKRELGYLGIIIIMALILIAVLIDNFSTQSQYNRQETFPNEEGFRSFYKILEYNNIQVPDFKTFQDRYSSDSGFYDLYSKLKSNSAIALPDYETFSLKYNPHFSLETAENTRIDIDNVLGLKAKSDSVIAPKGYKIVNQIPSPQQLGLAKEVRKSSLKYVYAVVRTKDYGKMYLTRIYEISDYSEHVKAELIEALQNSNCFSSSGYSDKPHGISDIEINPFNTLPEASESKKMYRNFSDVDLTCLEDLHLDYYPKY